MEGFEKQLDLSAEQEETLPELLNIVKERFDSFTNSDEAYETSERITEFYKNLKDQGFNPKEYYLWSLLTPEASKDINYPEFDTPNGDIESFIRNLAQSEELELAA